MAVEDLDTWEYEYDDETGTIRVNALGSVYGPSVEDYPEVMARVIDILREVGGANSIVLSASREYEYPEEQTQLLQEVADAIQDITREGYLGRENLRAQKCEKYYPEWRQDLQELVTKDLRRDPVGAYVKLRREIRHKREEMEDAYPETKRCYKFYIHDILQPLKERLEETTMVQRSQEHLTGYHVGDRALYREMFHPLVRPNFMLTKYMSLPPEQGEEIDRYTIANDVEVEIYRVPDEARKVYHITPPEFNLSEEKYTILDAARRYMGEHRPESGEFAKPERMRDVFANIGRDMIVDISEQMDTSLSSDEVDNLTDILTRYTAGLGVLELLFADTKIQDVYVNSPVGKEPVFLFHADYEECRTNLIPTREDAESWATRFRIQSGRPLDEANPVLDTEMEVPGGRARVAVVTRNLSPEGLAFAFRRHRDEPWTYPLFIDNDYFTPLAAGLMSFLIDGGRTMLISGTRSSGKTSLLGASLLELMKKTRLVTVEDSVTGDTPVLYREGGETRYGDIGDLIDRQMERHGRQEKLERDVLKENPDGVKVLSMSDDGEVRWSPVRFFMRHDVEKPIYEVETRTGRKIKVTEDHSLFTMGEHVGMEEVTPTDLSEGDYVVTPRQLPVETEESEWNLVERAGELDGYFIGDMDLRRRRSELEDLAAEHGYSASTADYWIRENILPAEIFDELEMDVRAEDVAYKHTRQSSTLPARIELDDRMMEFLGLWTADGCYDDRSVLVTVSDEKCREVVKAVFERFDLPVKEHSDGHTLMANSKPLKEVMELHGFDGDAYTKQVPEWLFSAADAQRRAFLRGLYSGDGYATEDEIGIDLINEDLIEDIQTLLLIDGIRGRARDSGKMRSMRISDLDGLKQFREEIGFLQEYKQQRVEVDGKVSTHDSTDVIPLPRRTLEEIELTPTETQDYLRRGNQVGRQKLMAMASGDREIGSAVKSLADSDIFWDQVRSVEKVADEETVYDVSVPGDENFVAGNILAHNTLELPVPALQDLGYNAERMKSRSVITQVESELPADEAIRTSLRLGDSALVLGEVRSDEAQALYEAMRIGAVANFVGGTIHGEDAYAVFDRVVNDLGVPATSFKATDIIVSANRLKSPSGTERFRRVTGITEVRKDWTEDPMRENGFVDLMRYDADQDRLVPTETLLNGESVILNRIADNVRAWKNDWEAVWDNIQLRKKVKQRMVDLSSHGDHVLEAQFTAAANEKFHTVSDEVQEEYGALDPERIYSRWNEWAERTAKRGLDGER